MAIGIYDAMDQPISLTSSGASAAQLRREAVKARKLADAAFGEEAHRQLIEIAVALEREAAMIEAAAAPGLRKTAVNSG